MSKRLGPVVPWRVGAVAVLVVMAGAWALGTRRGSPDAPPPEARLVRPIVSVRWRGATLPQAIDDIERLTGTRIAVRWDALKADRAAVNDPAIDADLHDVSAAAALSAALGQVPCNGPLQCAVRDGVPTVSTASNLARDVVVRAYDAGDLVDERYWPYSLREWDTSLKDLDLADAAAPPIQGPGGILCFASPPTPPSETRVEESARRLAGLAAEVGAAGFDRRLVVAVPEESQRVVRLLLHELRSGDARRPAVLLAPAPAEPPPAPRPATQPAGDEEQLARVIPELDLRDATLEQAFDRLRDLTHANLVVQWQALQAVGVKRDDPVKLRLWDVTLGRALAVLLAAATDDSGLLGYAGQDGIITVSTKDRLGHYTWIRVYDVRDLIVRLRASADALDDPSTRPMSAQTIVEYADVLTTLIRDTIDPDTWRDNGGTDGSVSYWSGRLIVTQTPANHRQVEQLLEDLRAESDKPVGATGRPPTRPASRPAGQ